MVNWQRWRKSPAELAYIRQGTAIVTSIHETIRKRVEPGLLKNELVAEIFASGIRGAEGVGGDYPAIVPLLPTGIEASAAHLTWNDKSFERGAAMYFEFAGCVNHYHAPLCRTVNLDKPPQSLLGAEQAVLEGVAAGIEPARAGNTATHIACAFYGAVTA